MREQEFSPESDFPQGIEILQDRWMPAAFSQLVVANAQLSAVEARYGTGPLSREDQAVIKEVVKATERVSMEWEALIREFFPGKRIEGLYAERPWIPKSEGNRSVQAWHQDGTKIWDDFEEADLILWSNREATEVRDRATKQGIWLPSGSVVKVSNGRYEHRRPPTVSPDRYLCHAAVWNR